MTDAKNDIQKLIQNIEQANELSDVLKVSDFKKEFNRIVKLIHPDSCKEKGGDRAFQKLMQLKETYEKRFSFTDEAGVFKMKGNNLIHLGDRNLLDKSLKNYKILKNKGDDASLHFHSYLPKIIHWGTSFEISFRERVHPASNLVLPQKHVNWILSRMLEFAAWMEQIGYVHGGINPESILIVPETHGIIIGSFYHMKAKGSSMKSVAARYKNWYPAELFDNKKATTAIDLELCKRTAAYLLGDGSGMGVKLKKTHHPAFVDFLLKRHDTAWSCYEAYRKMLADNFKREFHPLIL